MNCFPMYIHHDRAKAKYPTNYNPRPLNLWAQITFISVSWLCQVCVETTQNWLIPRPCKGPEAFASILKQVKKSWDMMDGSKKGKEPVKLGKLWDIESQRTVYSDHMLSSMSILNVARSQSTETKWEWFFFKVSLQLLCGEWVQVVRKEVMRIRIFPWLPRKEISECQLHGWMKIER